MLFSAAASGTAARSHPASSASYAARRTPAFASWARARTALMGSDTVLPDRSSPAPGGNATGTRSCDETLP
jgi:hypothetical protein